VFAAADPNQIDAITKMSVKTLECQPAEAMYDAAPVKTKREITLGFVT